MGQLPGDGQATMMLEFSSKSLDSPSRVIGLSSSIATVNEKRRQYGDRTAVFFE